MKAAYKDAVFGIALLVLSLFVLFWLIPVGIDSPGSVGNIALAPAFWPRLIIIAMVGLSVLLIFQGLRDIKVYRETGIGGERQHTSPLGTLKIAVATVMLFVLTWVMTWGGIVVPSMAALAFYMALHGERRLAVLVPVSIGLPVALYLFFLKVANSPMPLGIFEDLIM
jgi:hypothetical protein